MGKSMTTLSTPCYFKLTRPWSQETFLDVLSKGRDSAGHHSFFMALEEQVGSLEEELVS